MLIGQGIGPLRSRLLYRWAGRLLCRVDFAMVRDEPSMKLLSHWGLAGDRVVLGGDLALLLWPSWRALRAANARGTEGPRRLPMQQAEPIGRTYIVVCLKGELPEGVQAAMVRQLDHLSDELKIVFLALHPREDLSFMEEIAAQLARPALVLDTAGVSLKEVIECLAGAEAVVGMRLHALIFAMLAGRPFIAISAEPKIQSFLQQLEHSGGPEIPSFTLTQVENYTFELKEALSKISCEKALQQLEQAGEMLYMKTRTAVDLLMGRLAELAERGKGS
jgi:polysaccharide pyruvyl transferase WcaK-like protein